MCSTSVSVLSIVVLTACTHAFPDQGKWSYDLDQDRAYVAVQKSLFQNSGIYIKIECSGDSRNDMSINVSWTLRSTPCWEEYLNIQGIVNQKNDIIFLYFNNPSNKPSSYRYDEFGFIKAPPEAYTCEGVMQLHPYHGQMSTRSSAAQESKKIEQTPVDDKAGSTVKADEATAKAKREDEVETLPKPVQRRRRAADGEGATSSPPSSPDLKTRTPVYNVPVDGVYLLIVHMSPSGNEQGNFNATVNIEMRGPHGYLSAADWPLLPFYGCMCGLYVVYGVAWLIMSFMQWREILRVQYWIGAVILLGMLEKAVFYAEYQSINSTGTSVKGAVVFAELVSTAKRTLARILIIIVSLGFGIVKPRLGAMLHRVVGVGALYFLLGSIEGVLRVIRPKNDPSNQALLASIPLSVLDAAICWWIFSSLVQTLRTLRLRRNLVKLSLYRHFTNTLIFAVLASVAFMLWSIKYHRLQPCLTDWKELWVDDAYWHLLFSLILLVIIILWRPTINNQRYAFTPLLDADDDDDDDEDNMVPEAFEGMKQRGGTKSDKLSPKTKTPTEDDDLKWVEENIPASGPDDLLPKLLDSDEEIMTTQLERSKME